MTPLHNLLSSAAMYRLIIVGFDDHAVSESGIWSLRKNGVTSKWYAAAATIRYARSKTRRNIVTNGLPFEIGFFAETVPRPVGTLLHLGKFRILPTLYHTRDKSQQYGPYLLMSNVFFHDIKQGFTLNVSGKWAVRKKL
ncbi:unnamed protein product [Agarophyton chilense]